MIRFGLPVLAMSAVLAALIQPDTKLLPPAVPDGAELASIWVVGRQLDFRSETRLRRHFETSNEVQHFGLRDLPEPLEVVQLRLDLVVGTVEPVTFPAPR